MDVLSTFTLFWNRQDPNLLHLEAIDSAGEEYRTKSELGTVWLHGVNFNHVLLCEKA
jgi:hypothetical protein